jgi:hypothetical protein
VVRSKAILPVLMAGLLIACAGCGGARAPWTSHATFTIGNDPGRIGPFTSADSTVPPGDDGNAEIDLNFGLSPGTEVFSVTIGDDPGQATNVSQFKFLFPGYHGPGKYVLRSRLGNSEVDASVRKFEGSTNTWSTGKSPLATCTLRVTADRPTKARAIREITHPHRRAEWPLRCLRPGLVWWQPLHATVHQPTVRLPRGRQRVSLTSTSLHVLALLNGTHRR